MRSLRILLAALCAAVVLCAELPAAPGDVALYFGSFDPIHHGHLAVAIGARRELKVDTVHLIPERSAARKRPVAGSRHRVAMARLAALRNPGLSVPDPGMLRAARREGGERGWRDALYEFYYQRLQPGAMVLDVIGSDRLHEILRRRTYPKADEPRMLVVVDRPGHPLDTGLISRSGIPPGKLLFSASPTARTSPRWSPG